MVALNEQISVGNVDLAFAELQNHKAAGANGITAECFKAVQTDSHKDMNYILQLSWRTF